VINNTIPPTEYNQAWFSQLLNQLVQTLNYCVKTNEQSGRIILRSPNGQSWAVTVDNSGTITATEMNGSER
jgi:hypothetical protein